MLLLLPGAHGTAHHEAAPAKGRIPAAHLHRQANFVASRLACCLRHLADTPPAAYALIPTGAQMPECHAFERRCSRERCVRTGKAIQALL